MTVKFPPHDLAGNALQSQITDAQTAVTNASAATLVQQQQRLDALQRSAVSHMMATGWRPASTVLASFSPPAGDSVGAAITTAITALQTAITTASTKNPGLVPTLQAQLKAKQEEQVLHLMDVAGGTPAATILSTL